MTTIYLIRHAQCDGNLYRQYDGAYNSPLTNLGWQQAAALSERFEAVHLDAIYSSDQQRAVDTARTVAEKKGMTVQNHRGLREANIGLWDHMDVADIEELWPGRKDDFSERMHLWSAPGAEVLQEAGERVAAALWEIARRHDGETVAAVSHGDVIKMVLGLLQGMTLEQAGQVRAYSTNTAVSKLEFDGDAVRVLYTHDFSHLPSGLVSKMTADQQWGMRYRILGYHEPFPVEDVENVPERTEGIWIGGYVKGEPAALVQLKDTVCGQPGEIGFYYIVPRFRGRRLGIQPVGKIVDILRALKVPGVRIRLQKEEHQRYFSRRDNFVHVEGDIWERPIPPLLPLD